MESPTTKDALQRVSEAEKRIRMLADQVYNHQQGRDSAVDAAVTSPPAKTHSVLVRDTERTERKYEVLETRVRELESTVVELKKEIWKLKTCQSATLPDTSASTAPQTPPLPRSPANGSELGVSGSSPVRYAHTSKGGSDLHLECLNTIPTALSRGSMSMSGGSGEKSNSDVMKYEAIKQIHGTFDLDKDGHLNYNDASKMQFVTEQQQLTVDDYNDLCEYLGVDTAKGIAVNDLVRMYSDSNIETDLDRDVERARSFVCSSFFWYTVRGLCISTLFSFDFKSRSLFLNIK